MIPFTSHCTRPSSGEVTFVNT